MCVIPGCQTEMAHAVRGIFCLLHGPQGKPGEHGLLRRSRCPGEQLLDLLGMDLPVSDMKGVTEVVDQDRKPADLFLIGLFVGPVQKRDLLPVVILCHRLVGRQHKILNEHGGRVPLPGYQSLRPPLFIQ